MVIKMEPEYWNLLPASTDRTGIGDALRRHQDEIIKTTMLPPKQLYAPREYYPDGDWTMPFSAEAAMRMIGMRLRLETGQMLPFKHISAHVDNEVAVVFVLGNDNKHVTIEDDVALFPSDTLITQLRVLIG